MKLLATLALAACALLAPSLGRASVTYPAELMKRWDIEQVPAPAPYCTLCHRNDAGGTGTVSTPFGRALIGAGARGNSVPSLDGALDTLQAAGSDSDRDGVSDIEELRAGLDPNHGDQVDGGETSSIDDVPLPRTGCSVEYSKSGDALLGLGGLLIAVMVLRRRRRSG